MGNDSTDSRIIKFFMNLIFFIATESHLMLKKVKISQTGKIVQRENQTYLLTLIRNIVDPKE